MIVYTEEDLKSLCEYVRTVAYNILKQDPSKDTDYFNLISIVRQLEAIRFNPLLFKNLLKRHQVNLSLMEEPLKRIPLHINDTDIVSKTLVEWRCTNNK